MQLNMKADNTPFEVSVFTPEQARVLKQEVLRQHKLSKRGAKRWHELPERRLSGSLICAIVVAALHVAVLAPLLPTAGQQHRVFSLTTSPNGQNVDADNAIQISFIDSPAAASVANLATDPAPLQQIPPPTLEAPQPMTTPVSEVVSSASGDASGASALAGRYLNQIDARIERAWLRPRTALDAAQFQCQALIEQDLAGQVLEITLEQCNGDGRWQQSLARAIQAASPLPAPPDPAVFRRLLRLSFTAQAYSDHSPPQDYEPPVTP